MRPKHLCKVVLLVLALLLVSEVFLSAQNCLAVASDDAVVLSERLNDEALDAEDRGDFARAEQKLIQACAQAKLVGEQSLHFKGLLYRLGLLYLNSHKLDQAEAVLKKKLQLDESELGGLFTNEILDDLALLHLTASKRERWNDALALAKRQLQVLCADETKYALAERMTGHISRVGWNQKGREYTHFKVLWQVVEANAMLGNIRDAEAAVRDADAYPKRPAKIESWVVVPAANAMAAYYMKAKQYDKAEAAWCKALNTGGSQSWDLGVLMHLHVQLCAALIEMKKYKLAEEHARTFLKLAKSEEPPIPNKVLDAYLRICQSLHAQERFIDLEKVALAANEAASQLQATPERRATVFVWLTQSYRRQNKFALAERYCRKELAIAEKLSRQSAYRKDRFVPATAALLEILFQQNKFAEQNERWKQLLQSPDGQRAAEFPDCLEVMAWCYVHDRKYALAEKTLLSANKIHATNKQYMRIAVNLYALATITAKQSKSAQTEQYLNQSLATLANAPKSEERKKQLSDQITNWLNELKKQAPHGQLP